MKLREVISGKRRRRLMRKDAHCGTLGSSVSQCRGASFPNGQLLLRSSFSYYKHYRRWKCININQMLCPGPERHCSKFVGPCSKAGQHMSASHEARHPMLIPTWTASCKSGMRPEASVKSSKKPTGLNLVSSMPRQ